MLKRITDLHCSGFIKMSFHPKLSKYCNLLQLMVYIYATLRLFIYIVYKGHSDQILTNKKLGPLDSMKNRVNTPISKKQFPPKKNNHTKYEPYLCYQDIDKVQKFTMTPRLTTTTTDTGCHCV